MSKINNTKLIGGIEKQQKTISLDLDNSKKTINSSSSSRSISQIIKSETTQDGEGVTLNRSFPNTFISEFDPFLLLDEIGPTDLIPGKQKGFLITPTEDLKPLPTY
jgi:hypothetical protein